MTRPLRAVVLGYGFIGTMHVEAAATLVDVDVVGVAGHHLDRATEFARRHDIERVTTDWASLCAEPDVDLVIIGTPNALHADQAIHALDHAKHVLVEKPMTTTTVDADRMIDAATRAERTLAVGHMWRYHPDVIALRDRVAKVSATARSAPPPSHRTICAPSVPPHDLRPLRPGMRDPRGADCAWGTAFFRSGCTSAHWEGMHLSNLDHLATTNHGVVSRSTSGLSRSSWYRAIAAGQLEQVYPGVARLHGTARTSEQRIAATVLATGPSSMASHRSAAHLWGIPRPDDDPVDVIVVGSRRRFTGFDEVTIHRPRDLERLTPQRRSGIVCTNALRAVLDLGAVDRAAVSDAVGHIITNRLATLNALESVVTQHSEHGRTGIVALREAVAEWSIDAKPTDSMLEQTMHRLIIRHRLPPVEFHPLICGYEVDFRVIGTPVILECDGWAYHGLQRSNFERDRQRDADLLAAGWIVLRFTYRAITTRPKDTAERIAATIARWT